MENVILITFILLILIFYYYFDEVRNYFKVIVSISIFGSLFLPLYDFNIFTLIKNWNNPEYAYSISWMFAFMQISFLTSTILAFLSIIPLYFLEKKNTNYFGLNFLIFSINFGTLTLILYLNNFETKEIQEMTFNFFVFYYLPGVVAYYFFVHRPRKKLSE